MPLDPATDLPLRAMTRGLAEMQTSLMTAALPMFDGRVDRFMVFTLLGRRTFDGGRPIPVLSIADSLRLPFETTRRHVAALAERGWCRRDRGGVVLVGTPSDPPLGTLAPLAHDCLVRFVADLGAIGAIPAFERSARSYSWHVGWLTAADLMLAVADSNAGTHQDRVNLVLFSTILCANSRPVALDPGLARRYAALLPPPPAELKQGVRPSAVCGLLAVPKATFRRRLDVLLHGPVRHRGDGLVIDEAWLLSPRAIETSTATWANVRRFLAVLAMQGFPFEEPERAYVVGRPPLVSFA